MAITENLASRVAIRPAQAADCDALARIYNHYVAHTTITFEEHPITAADMEERWREVDSVGLPYLVADCDGCVHGYAYASKWKGRRAYRFTVEVSVYLDPEHLRRGLGSLLYRRLFQRLGERGIHVAIGGIALPNDASVALHEKLGLQKVAHFAEVGFKFGCWVDVGYWQRVLENS